MPKTKTVPGIWVGQLLHLAGLVILLGLVGIAWRSLGAPFPAAFWIAIAFPVVHQVYVWLTWRLELRDSAISHSIGFRVYVGLFFVLFAGRFVSLFMLAWLDRGSLGLPAPPRILITLLLVAVGFYAMHSVLRDFGMVRASGADHFEARYRRMPLVRKGIFRFTSHGMYVAVFLLFWAIAVGLNSATGLTVAAFSHAYIWVHFFATEKPDMEYLYGPDGTGMES
tara:strand:- start:6393 stop:7064 length:672 start_codon:yes stop_codon:yes gene_type:complete